MTNTLHEKRKIYWSRYGFENLLVWLFVYLMVGPFLEAAPYADMIMIVMLTIVLFSAIYTVDRGSRMFISSIILLTLNLALLWLNTLQILRLPAALTSSLLILYLGGLVYSISGRLFNVRQVSANVICAALCLYLFMGILWGAIFAMLESLAPGSFAGNLLSQASSPAEISHHLNYFSFVTLSTLGYGDITPQTQGAAALCQAEAILGQFFALVVVARLVGIQVAQEPTGEN